MKHAPLFLVATVLVFAGCSREGTAPSTGGAPAPADEAKVAKDAPAPVPPVPAVASPERIAEITASGRTGFWSSVPGICKADVARRLRTTLTWNVSSSGAKRVILYVVDPQGQERNFGQGGPVGEKQSGPWLRPGLTFRLRDYDSKSEVGNIVIQETPCG